MWNQPLLLSVALDSEAREWLAYLAGFVDVDGSISLAELKSNCYNSSFRLTLSAFNACLKPLKLFRKTFGGKIDSYPPRPHQTEYQNRWRLGGSAARVALLDMMPFLRIKQSQAQLGILYEERRQAIHRPCGYRPYGFVAFAQEISQQLKLQKHQDINYMVKQIESSYLAGLFDSDGCTAIVRRSKGSGRRPVYSLSAHIECRGSMPIVRLLQRRYGGSVFISKTGLDCWGVEGAHAKEFLMDIQPWLLVKKEQAQVGCTFEKLRVFEREKWVSRSEYSDSYYTQAQELYQIVRDLK